MVRRFYNQLEPFHRSDFSKGTRGSRGLCSVPSCPRNARWSYLVVAHCVTGARAMRHARCDIHVKDFITVWLYPDEYELIRRRRRRDLRRVTS